MNHERNSADRDAYQTGYRNGHCDQNLGFELSVSLTASNPAYAHGYKDARHGRVEDPHCPGCHEVKWACMCAQLDAHALEEGGSEA